MDPEESKHHVNKEFLKTLLLDSDEHKPVFFLAVIILYNHFRERIKNLKKNSDNFVPPNLENTYLSSRHNNFYSYVVMIRKMLIACHLMSNLL